MTKNPSGLGQNHPSTYGHYLASLTMKQPTSEKEKEVRREIIKQSFEKATELNGKALEKLSNN